MKISKNQIKRVVKDMKRALSLLELELEVRARAEVKPKRPRSINALKRKDVVELFRIMGHPATVDMALLQMAKNGRRPTKLAVGNHIHQALLRGELVRLSRGLFEYAPVSEAAQ